MVGDFSSIFFDVHPPKCDHNPNWLAIPHHTPTKLHGLQHFFHPKLGNPVPLIQGLELYMALSLEKIGRKKAMVDLTVCLVNGYPKSKPHQITSNNLTTVYHLKLGE
jgi:hypothetical protein